MELLRRCCHLDPGAGVERRLHPGFGGGDVQLPSWPSGLS